MLLSIHCNSMPCTTYLYISRFIASMRVPSIMCAFLFCFLLLCSLSPTSLAEAAKTLSGFSIDLIHRDSPLSPFYNPSLTPSERIKSAALRSIARSNRLISLSLDESPKTITIPDEANGEYLLRFYIGTPPVERYATADTGSQLIWVQCSPCKNCLPQDPPLFDPRKSSTFRAASCDSQPCTLLSRERYHCGKSGECKYFYSYGDNSFTAGTLGVESISFGPNSKGVEFPMFTFGCGYNNSDPDVGQTKGKTTGLVGLAQGPLSLVSQLGYIGSKFSYCLLPYGSNSTSRLKFGNEATIKGKGVVSTPLIHKISGLYCLNLEGISIGKKKVKNSKSQTDGNIIIDSGTTLTILRESFYNKFVALVKEVLGVEAEENPPDSYDFCFRYEDSIDKLPHVVFHFTGAKVRLRPLNMFTSANDDLFCMLALPTSEDGLSLFGNRAQANFQVEYDAGGGKVSFAAADCAKH